MDAYDIHQEIFKAWQQLAHYADASTIKKNFLEVPVYVDGKIVKRVTIVDGKIILETK
jgi:hypothetical protein